MKRIFVDSNTRTSAPEGIVKILERYTPLDNTGLRTGKRVMLYDGEMEVEAVLQCGDRSGHWQAMPNRAIWRDIPSPTPSADDLQRWSA
ncbi:MAG: hypothetical protein ACHQ4H_17680 [Ktedonobacterales bacterium]|jgi:hypothetical protein